MEIIIPAKKIMEVSIARLKEFEPSDGYYFADSGGKDSCVVRELLRRSGVKFDAHYQVTTIDPPELCKFLRQQHPETKWEWPQKPFLKRLIEKGFPMRQNRWCCKEYKERGGKGRVVVTGIRSAESKRRATRRMVEQCTSDNSKTYLHPIIDWSHQDVWGFIRHEKIPYCSLYDEGFRRIGCVLCCYNYSRLEEAQRWPGIIKAYKKAFDRLYEQNHTRPSYQRWVNGEEMFRWWVSKKPQKINKNQLSLFE